MDLKAICPFCGEHVYNIKGSVSEPLALWEWTGTKPEWTPKGSDPIMCKACGRYWGIEVLEKAIQ